MKILETERLFLRRFCENDFEAVHSYAGCRENLTYVNWGPNTPEQTRDFIKRAISETDESSGAGGTNNTNAGRGYYFAIVLKNSGKLIGGCDISVKEDWASLGWILHRDFWNQGYCTEAGRALLKYGFDELNLRRITAICDAENIGSYRVMEKIGMRREGFLLESRPPNKIKKSNHCDELSYAIIKDEWEIQKEIIFYNNSPCKFSGFLDLPELTDDEIHLVCTAKKPGIPEKKFVPGYDFIVCKGSEKVGDICLRVGYTDSLYYGGQIGYNTDEKYRGNNYAGRACRLLLPVAKAHGMTRLLITNNISNIASWRVCEKLGARLLRRARLPQWHDLY
ncbi:MAG: GNAT family N-acetyltransferase, partial [Treponema sp.]|nr:GNAT family N-acetyltransferase [Treponema sp.]